ncbi:MFS transporter [Sphaerimonospora thailandensis]|uniref:MFS transporter n=1 Tax=Sphaerimonospora thailandensis TaxID=795644 RepID=A0A8J3W1B2_9ACTN|nr:MFS transporter [Sphaerimonospora thailandensis]GIH71596.1 MFS transporter [Sphaerimonospora thailandensis]
MRATEKRTLIGINAGISLAHVGNYIYLPILVPTLAAAHSGFWAGFVIFLTYVGRLLSTFFYEGVTARLGNRNGVIVGVLIEAFAIGLMGFVSGIPLFSVLAFFVGFGSGMSFPGLKNIIGKFSEEYRPKAFASFQMACQLGLLGGAMLGGVFAGVDLRVLFTVVFALFLVYCLAAFSMIPVDLEDRPEEATPLFSAAVLKGLRVGGGAQYFLLSSVFWVLAVTFFVGMPLHMSEFVPEWFPSVPFWITGVALLVLQFPTFKFMIKRFEPGHVMAVGFGSVFAAHMLFGAGRSATWVVIGCVIVVFGDILFTPSFDLWVSKKMPKDRLAKAMGAMHFFRSFGNMVGSLTAGLLFDLAIKAGIPGLNWYIAGAVALLCALFSMVNANRETAGKRVTGVVAEPRAEPVES